MAGIKVSVTLIPQAQEALDNLVQVTEITNKADVINRALQVYNLIATAQAEGKEIYLHNPNLRQVSIISNGRVEKSNADEVWQRVEIK